MMIRNLLRNYHKREFYAWFGTIDKSEEVYIQNPFIDNICQEKKISRKIELEADVVPGTEIKNEKISATPQCQKTPQKGFAKQESQANTLDAK